MGLTFVDNGNTSDVATKPVAIIKEYCWEDFQRDLVERKAPGNERFIAEDCQAEFDIIPLGYRDQYLNLRDDREGGGGLLRRDTLICIITEIEGVSGFVECFLKHRNPGPGRNRRPIKEARKLVLKELGRC